MFAKGIAVELEDVDAVQCSAVQESTQSSRPPPSSSSSSSLIGRRGFSLRKRSPNMWRLTKLNSRNKGRSTTANPVVLTDGSQMKMYPDFVSRTGSKNIILPFLKRHKQHDVPFVISPQLRVHFRSIWSFISSHPVSRNDSNLHHSLQHH